MVLEAQDGVGGRVRTDRHEGFLLDRGFQIFLTSYPEAQVGLGNGAESRDPVAWRLLVHVVGHPLTTPPPTEAAGLRLP